MNKNQNDRKKVSPPETEGNSEHRIDKLKFSSDVDSNRGNGTHPYSSRTNR